jgi:hypothetical protein
MPAKAVNGRSSLSANQTTSFFLVSGFGSGAYSAKLLNGTRRRFSAFSQPRQCGEEVLRTLVTGGLPVRWHAPAHQRHLAAALSILILLQNKSLRVLKQPMQLHTSGSYMHTLKGTAQDMFSLGVRS